MRSLTRTSVGSSDEVCLGATDAPSWLAIFEPPEARALRSRATSDPSTAGSSCSCSGSFLASGPGVAARLEPSSLSNTNCDGSGPLALTSTSLSSPFPPRSRALPGLLLVDAVRATCLTPELVRDGDAPAGAALALACSSAMRESIAPLMRFTMLVSLMAVLGGGRCRGPPTWNISADCVGATLPPL